MNHYAYCWNKPLNYVDLNGLNPIGDFFGELADTAVDFWNENIVGSDTIYYETDANGMKYEVKVHKGGNIFVGKYRKEGETSVYTGWSINAEVNIPNTDNSFNYSMSGESWNPKTWEYSQTNKIENKETGLYAEYGYSFDSKGLNFKVENGGKADTMPIPLPKGKRIDPKLDASWSLSMEQNHMTWGDLATVALVIGAVVVVAVVVLDDGTVVGIGDNGALVPLGSYTATQGSMLVDKFSGILTRLPEMINQFSQMRPLVNGCL